MAVLIRSLVMLCVLVGAGSLPAARIDAQNATAPDLTAAFLINFVKFAAWPDDALPANAVFTYCVAGDQAIVAALEHNLKSHPGTTHVLFVAVDGPLGACQILYLGGVDLRQARKSLASVQGASIFTVSDVDGFTESGGIAQLRLERGRMRFAINPVAAQRARLSLSAKLLGLATITRDGPNANR
jgi:uncharacterized protein DUF4154